MQRASIGLAVLFVLSAAACAPASAQAPAPQAPAAPLTTERDPLDRALATEGLLGVLNRIDAELGHTIDGEDKADKKERAKSDFAAASAKGAPRDGQGPEKPSVTWGADELEE